MWKKKCRNRGREIDRDIPRNYKKPGICATWIQGPLKSETEEKRYSIFFPVSRQQPAVSHRDFSVFLYGY